MFDHATLPSTADLGECELVGWKAFWAGEALTRCAADPAAQRGWWMAHRVAYAQGWHAGATAADVENPYPQFSGAWEAWGDDNNDAADREVA